MNYEILTPVTFKLEFEHIQGFRWHKTNYYSLLRAINCYFHYKQRLGTEYVVRLYAFKGDYKLQEIDVNKLLN